jgi:hypothetical protein
MNIEIMAKSDRSRLNKIIRDNISRKIHLSIDGDIVCGQKKPYIENELAEWSTKGKLRCQKCLNIYNKN